MRDYLLWLGKEVGRTNNTFKSKNYKSNRLLKSKRTNYQTLTYHDPSIKTVENNKYFLI